MKMDREIKAKDVKRLLLKVYRDLKGGNISDSQAYRETFVLNNILKAIELTDIQERLTRIEGLLSE